MRVLITGHRGFVGRHLFAHHQRAGHEVLGVDIADVPGRAYDARTWFRSDLSPVGYWDLVIHCAAVVGGRTMIDGARLQLAVEDLTLDAELFRWAMRARPGRIVYFSSSAAYPVVLQREHNAHPLHESHITLGNPTAPLGQPDATYGWVKLTGEQLAAEANAEGIPTFVFRPFSGYGDDQDLAYPFPAIIRRALDHKPGRPFHVWGDPESTRDWVHIDDVVACVAAHLEADERGPVNICTGRATSFAHLAWLALEAARPNEPCDPIYGDAGKPMGVFHRVGNPGRMLRTYVPDISIEEGVTRAVAAMRSA